MDKDITSSKKVQEKVIVTDLNIGKSSKTKTAQEKRKATTSPSQRIESRKKHKVINQAQKEGRRY